MNPPLKVTAVVAAVAAFSMEFDRPAEGAYIRGVIRAAPRVVDASIAKAVAEGLLERAKTRGRARYWVSEAGGDLLEREQGARR